MATLGVYAVTFIAAAAEGDAPPDFDGARDLRDVIMDLARGQAQSRDVAASLTRTALREAAAAEFREALGGAVAV